MADEQQNEKTFTWEKLVSDLGQNIATGRSGLVDDLMLDVYVIIEEAKQRGVTPSEVMYDQAYMKGDGFQQAYDKVRADITPEKRMEYSAKVFESLFSLSSSLPEALMVLPGDSRPMDQLRRDQRYQLRDEMLERKYEEQRTMQAAEQEKAVTQEPASTPKTEASNAANFLFGLPPQDLALEKGRIQHADGDLDPRLAEILKAPVGEFKKSLKEVKKEDRQLIEAAIRETGEHGSPQSFNAQHSYANVRGGPNNPVVDPLELAAATKVLGREAVQRNVDVAQLMLDTQYLASDDFKQAVRQEIPQLEKHAKAKDAALLQEYKEAGEGATLPTVPGVQPGLPNLPSPSIPGITT